MSNVDVIQLRKDGEPVRPNRSVAQLAKHLGVSFAPNDLQLSVVALARKVESLEFEVQLLRHELRKPLWQRLADKLKGSGEQR